MATSKELPTLDMFMEDSGNPLVVTSGGRKPETPAGNGNPPPDDKAKADAEAKVKADAELAAKAADDKKKADDAAKAAADVEKKKKENVPGKPEPTEAELEALLKKVDEKPETVTEEEKKLLLEKGLIEVENPSNFWDDVEKIHGIKIEADFQGKDPESPEYAAIRDQAIMDMAAKQQLEFLANTYPEAFQILEHVAAGGKTSDLISGSEPDYSKITLEKEDKEGQKELLLNYYLQKGFEEKDAKRYVEADEDSTDGLLAVAQKALKQLQATQADKTKQVIERQKAVQAEEAKRNTLFKQSIKQITDSGKLGDFSILSKKDREEFYQFAVNNIYSDGKNGYQIVMPVNDKSVVPVLQQMFFGFKGGKLDEFIKKEAQTQNVIRLKRKVAQAAAGAGGQEGDNKNQSQKTLPTFDTFKAE